MHYFIKSCIIILVLNILVSGKISAQSPVGKWRNQDFEKGNNSTDLVYKFTHGKIPSGGIA